MYDNDWTNLRFGANSSIIKIHYAITACMTYFSISGWVTDLSAVCDL